MIGIPYEFAPSSLVHYEQVSLDVQVLLKDSRTFRLKREWMRAERCALDAQDICKDAIAHVGLAVAQLYLVDVYREVGELGRAMEQCKEAYQTLERQPARVQRHNEAVAAYALGLLHELRLFGGGTQALHWYRKALQQFKVAQEHWAALNNRSQFKTCQRVCQWIEKRKDQIVDIHTGEQVGLSVFDIWRLDSADAPFAGDDGLHGHITDDDHVSINGIIYRLHSGSLPRIGADGAHYYFALPVPENHWAVSEAQVGDYVLVRQQWWLDKEQAEEDRPGVVWEPGNGWVEVNFKRGRDGKIRSHYPHPRIIGNITPPGDPAGRMKGYITALLKPEREAFDFAGVVIEGLGADSTLVLNKEYKLRAGFPKKDSGSLTGQSVYSSASPMEIDITVHAPGMEVLPDWTQSLKFFPGRDSGLLEFTLTPREIPRSEIPGEEGKTQIEINFYHQRHWLAKLQFPVKVIDT